MPVVERYKALWKAVNVINTTMEKDYIMHVVERFFVDHLCYFCLVFVMLSCMSVYCCLSKVTCWERVDLLVLVCDV